MDEINKTVKHQIRFHLLLAIVGLIFPILLVVCFLIAVIDSKANLFLLFSVFFASVLLYFSVVAIVQFYFRNSVRFLSMSLFLESSNLSRVFSFFFCADFFLFIKRLKALQAAIDRQNLKFSERGITFRLSGYLPFFGRRYSYGSEPICSVDIELMPVPG